VSRFQHFSMGELDRIALGLQLLAPENDCFTFPLLKEICEAREVIRQERRDKDFDCKPEGRDDDK